MFCGHKINLKSFHTSTHLTMFLSDPFPSLLTPAECVCTAYTAHFIVPWDAEMSNRQSLGFYWMINRAHAIHLDRGNYLLELCLCYFCLNLNESKTLKAEIKCDLTVLLMIHLLILMMVVMLEMTMMKVITIRKSYLKHVNFAHPKTNAHQSIGC